MGKNEIRGYFVYAIIFIVFSVITFATPFVKTGIFWLAYLFGVIAIAYQIYVFQISFNQGNDVKKMLQDLADEFKYSDPVSYEATKEMETELKFLVNEIQRAFVDGYIKFVEGFLVRAKAGLAERNRICRLEK